MMQSEKSTVTAYVLWLAVGAFGGHRFYLGRNISGAIQAIFLLVGSVILGFAMYKLFQMIDENPSTNFMDPTTTRIAIVSWIGSFLLLVWFIWYLLDLVLIAVMLSKDRRLAQVRAPADVETVFK